jgi:hypothetical protein
MPLAAVRLAELFADRAVEQLPRLLHVAEQERQADRAVLGNDVGDRPLAVGRHVERARAQRRDHRGVVAELRRVRHLDLDAAVGLGLDALGEQHGRLVARVARRGAVAEGELGRLRLAAKRRRGAGGQREQRANKGLALHGLVSWCGWPIGAGQ